MKCLDLFCGAGGCGMGYNRAGFEVVGVDINPQPRYPFEFIQADALEYLNRIIRTGEVEKFDLIHASPPCQAYSRSEPIKRSIRKKEHPDLIGPVRELLVASGKPYIIENVEGAPLNGTIMLCGTMFGLRVLRHRIFECNPPIYWPPVPCNHNGKRAGSRLRDENGQRVIQSFERVDFICVVGHDYKVDDGREAMGISWMTRDELSQAIPPKYTEWLGKRMAEMIGESDPLPTRPINGSNPY